MSDAGRRSWLPIAQTLISAANPHDPYDKRKRQYCTSTTLSAPTPPKTSTKVPPKSGQLRNQSGAGKADVL